MMFRVGEKVVYPNQGVGRVEKILLQSLGARQERFYLLRFDADGVTVMAPCASAAGAGLRPVAPQLEISRLLAFLAGGPCAVTADWKARYKQNLEKMRSGELLPVAEVLKSLLLLQARRPLSLQEKTMLDRVSRMLAAETAAALGVAEEPALAALAGALAHSGLRWPGERAVCAVPAA